MINFIKEKLLGLDSHTKEVIMKSSSSMLVRVTSMLVALLVSIFLGRTLGPDGVGIIGLSNRIATLLLVFSMFGMDNVIVKNIAIAFENKNWQEVRNNIFSAIRFNGLLALSITIIVLLFVDAIINQIFNEADLKIPFIIAISMLLPRTLSRIFAAGLKGFRKIWQSNLVNEALSLWVVGIGLIVFYQFNIEINVINVAILYALGSLFVTISIATFWKKSVFTNRGGKKNIIFSMLPMALPMLFVSATAIIASNADAIMLGWLSNTKEVGLYHIAAKIGYMSIFFLQISNSAISPKLATLYAEKNISDMNQMVQRVTGGLILIGLFTLALFFFFGGQILTLWGESFREAYWILLIVAIGQFINISTGCSGFLLIMCGQERLHGYISIIAVSVNLILNFILIPSYGAIGAAFATSITISLENILKVYFAYHKTGVLTFPRIFKNGQ